MNANRIYRYKKDLLSDKDATELNEIRDRLKCLIRDIKIINNDSKLQDEIQIINIFLHKIGGKIYPKTFWIDNIEVGLVALVIVIGIRTFFFQPFIIPTNSMYPTYSGMNEIIYPLRDGPQNSINKLFNKLILGSNNYYHETKTDGRVSIPLFSQAQFSKDANLRNLGFVSFQYVKGKKWFGLIPAKFREYELYVGKTPVKITVPFDYSLDKVILKTYFPGYETYKELIEEYHSNGHINIFKDTRHKIKSSKIAKKGDALISFDITLGDALFVDRFTYHFKKPKAGDPFVFKTSEMKLDYKIRNSLGDKYFIKRIGGISEEQISITDGKLCLNNKPRNEVEAFKKNGNKEGKYNGYKADGILAQGKSITIPDGYYFALGDNSYNSHDSRYFGVVNKEAVIGKAFFIYYPFTKRWGLSK